VGVPSGSHGSEAGSYAPTTQMKGGISIMAKKAKGGAKKKAAKKR